MRGRYVRFGATVLAFGLLAAACGDDDDDDDAAPADDAAAETTSGSDGTSGGSAAGPVECDGLALAFFGALTGDNANLGITIRNGAQLAIDQFNEQNPDCQIELVELDSQGSPDQAPALAQQAIDDESVVGIIGPAFSGETAAATPLFDEAGVPIVTPSATNPNLSQEGWTVFHRMLASDAEQGPGIAAYLRDTAAVESVFVIDDASEYGAGLGGIVIDELGDLVIGEDTITAGATDFSATVTAVTDAEPAAVFFAGYYSDAGLLVRQLRDAGFEGLFMSGDGTKDPGFIEAGGDATEGAIVTCTCAPSSEEFTSAYEEAYGEPPATYGPEAYDAANAFLEAIRNGAQDRESILEFLGTIDIEGETKQISFDETGETADRSVYIYRVTDGEIVDEDTA